MNTSLQRQNRNSRPVLPFIASVCIVSACLVVLFPVQALCQNGGQAIPKMAPYLELRNEVKGLTINDIKAIELYGVYTPYTKQQPLIVQDRTVCSLFLKAYQQANYSGPRWATEYACVALRLNKRVPRKNMRIAWGYIPSTDPNSGHWNGPAFDAALEALGAYQVRKMQAEIASHRSQIAYINLVREFSKKHKILTGQEMQRFLEELKHANYMLFRYNSPIYFIGVRAHLKNGKELKYHCMLPSELGLSPQVYQQIPATLRKMSAAIKVDYDGFHRRYNSPPKQSHR